MATTMIRDTSIGLYRRNITSPERLANTTVGRTDILDELCEDLESSARENRHQHYVLIGPRGIGKTHLLTRLLQRLDEIPSLQSAYIPLRFPEENNRILSFADLLLGVLELLAVALDDQRLLESYDQLALEEDNEQVVETILPILRRFHRKDGRRLLILLENLDILLTDQIKSEQNIHALRSFLMDEDIGVLLASSPVLFPGLYSERQPLYDFFDIRLLDELDEAQTVELIRANLEWDHKEDLLQCMDELAPRIHALHDMTGGNPRLILMLYELIAYDNVLEVKRQFQLLLDGISPFYQDRLKELPAQERAILETLALMRDPEREPRIPTNIARRMRMGKTQVSALLGRMLKAGYLIQRDNPKDKRSKIYRIKEGFFDLWLAMSQSRRQRHYLPYVVEFLAAWYADETEREHKREVLRQQLQQAGTDPNATELLAHLTEVGTPQEQCQTKVELAFELAQQDPMKVQALLDESILQEDGEGLMAWVREQTLNLITDPDQDGIREHVRGLINYWRSHRSGQLERAAEIALKLGNDFSRQGLYRLNIELMRDALKHTDEPEQHLNYLCSIADSQLRLALHTDAAKTVDQMESIARSRGLDQWIAKIYGPRALLFYEMGKHEEAEDLLRQAIIILRASLPEEHPDIIAFHAFLGSLLFIRKAYVDAEAEIHYVLSVWKKDTQIWKEGTIKALLAWGLLGMALLFQGKLTPLAKQSLEQALMIARGLLGADHPATKKLERGLASLD